MVSPLFIGVCFRKPVVSGDFIAPNVTIQAKHFSKTFTFA
ncbi:hypothetical protein FLJC2902T_04370 [Flavobacterium limnosediminis JC2902]|uniref:Uncharacterized protein n=1 Tax=Flavobacterium limnosediminis JC2902 TaxID=1341181 RepID=V6SU07_9FLAO|nr:hypothetical protein FLJC2902T_04370 [Flavobacterium limnosediminis JC2902]